MAANEHTSEPPVRTRRTVAVLPDAAPIEIISGESEFTMTDALSAMTTASSTLYLTMTAHCLKSEMIGQEHDAAHQPQIGKKIKKTQTHKVLCVICDNHGISIQ